MLLKPQFLFSLFACLAGVHGFALAEEDAPEKTPVEVRKIGSGYTLTFDKETYVLRQNLSTPTSELRQYLRGDETQEDYRKMITLRVQPSDNDDAMTLAQRSLGQMLKDYPGSYMQQIEMTPEVATIMLVLVKNQDVELNLWHFRKTRGGGLPSVHFALRNRRPYETQRKFKAEQKKNLEDWVRDIKTLGTQVEAFVVATKVDKVSTTATRRASR